MTGFLFLYDYHRINIGRTGERDGISCIETRFPAHPSLSALLLFQKQSSLFFNIAAYPSALYEIRTRCGEVQELKIPRNHERETH